MAWSIEGLGLDPGRGRLPLWLAALGLLAVIALSSSGCRRLPKPVSNWTRPQAIAFREFPLFWLGESFDGLPLTAMRISVDGDDVTHAAFRYGDPSFVEGSSGGGTWYAPLEIDIQPYCGYSPEEHRSYYDDLVEVRVRGVSGSLQRYSSTNSSLFLWSGGSSIHVQTWKSEIDVEQAAENLIPIASDGGTATRPFPPPIATSC